MTDTHQLISIASQGDTLDLDALRAAAGNCAGDSLVDVKKLSAQSTNGRLRVATEIVPKDPQDAIGLLILAATDPGAAKVFASSIIIVSAGRAAAGTGVATIASAGRFDPQKMGNDVRVQGYGLVSQSNGNSRPFCFGETFQV